MSRRRWRRFMTRKNEREEPLLVGPLRHWSPAPCAQQQAGAARTVFDAVLGVDSLALGQGERPAIALEADIANGLEMHLDARLRVVPSRDVAKGVYRYGACQLPVDPMQQIEVER